MQPRSLLFLAKALWGLAVAEPHLYGAARSPSVKLCLQQLEAPPQQCVVLLSSHQLAPQRTVHRGVRGRAGDLGGGDRIGAQEREDREKEDHQMRGHRRRVCG